MADNSSSSSWSNLAKMSSMEGMYKFSSFTAFGTSTFELDTTDVEDVSSRLRLQAQDAGAGFVAGAPLKLWMPWRRSAATGLSLAISTCISVEYFVWFTKNFVVMIVIIPLFGPFTSFIYKSVVNVYIDLVNLCRVNLCLCVCVRPWLPYWGGRLTRPTRHSRPAFSQQIHLHGPFSSQDIWKTSKHLGAL